MIQTRLRRRLPSASLCGVAMATALWLTACAARAEGLRFAYESAARFGGSEHVTVMTMRGEVEEGDALHFSQFMLDRRERFIEHGGKVVFAIDGGDVTEAVRIGELLREALADAWLPDAASSRCISACFFMFVHAVSRTAVPDALGMHRPYFEQEALAKASPAAVRARYESLETELRTRMQQLSVPIALVVYWLSREDLALLGRRQAWFDDYLAAKCGRPALEAGSSPGSSIASCVDALLRSHRKGLVDRLAAERG
jgi:hypothetical protein